MIEAIKKTLALLSKRDKRIIYLLAIASILVSLVETLAVAIIMPYIQLASDFSFISTNSYLNYVYNNMGFSSEYIFVVACGGLLILFYIARSFINIIYQFYMVKFSQTRYHHFACALFSNYMLMPYTSYTNKNTSHLSKTIITEANNFIGILSNLLMMLSEAFVFIAIYSMMIYTNWKMSLLITILILINIIFLYFSVSRPIKKSGINREKYESVFFKVLNDSLSNFKSLKLKSNNQEIEKKLFKC